jgi:hypothetical protein
MNSVEKLKQFEQALKLFLERVAADPNLLAAVLVGSLSEETIWRRDALGLWVIEKDGVTKRLRADGEIVGKSVQLHAFERPTTHREFAEDLGAPIHHAAFSPDGRWLAASGDKQAGVWDLAGGGPAALDDDAYLAHFFFTPDARELFGARNKQEASDCFRWRLRCAKAMAVNGDGNVFVTGYSTVGNGVIFLVGA